MFRHERFHSGNKKFIKKIWEPTGRKQHLFDSYLNATIFRNGYYIHTVPITEAGGNIEGAVLLSYQIKMTYANDRGRLAAVIIGLALFSQFIYIIGFTFLFSRIQAEKINYPLRLLTDAAKNIREKNLDFEIDYHSDNELGRLCSAFSDMKEELNSSLSAQWHMEQERVTMTVALAHDLGCGKAVTYHRQYHIQQPAVYTQRRQDYDGCIAWKRTGML